MEKCNHSIGVQYDFYDAGSPWLVKEYGRLDGGDDAYIYFSYCPDCGEKLNHTPTQT